jgi:hypothetical protein
MGWFSRTFGSEEREYHDDGSYTDRNERRGTSATYDSDGNLREYSITKVPLLTPARVDTYDSDGNKVNSQIRENL